MTTPPIHSHVFLGSGHQRSERRTWLVIALCAIMMAVEIAGGLWFGSVALVADGLHMSTHAGALLIAALAYTYARRHAADRRFSFGTGKLGDLAGFTSAIVLAMIALLIGVEAISRLISPVKIDFDQAIAIAAVGLLVNVLSAWLLGGGSHGHEHGHEHGHSRGPAHGHGHSHGHAHAHDDHGHEHAASPATSTQVHEAPGHAVHRDNNARAALVHVIADAAVSVVVICGLVAGRQFGWPWIDPVVAIVGSAVIANWAFGLVRDTGRILLDMDADPDLADAMRKTLEADGDEVVDLHLWRLGPGHLGAIVSVLTPSRRPCSFYLARLSRFSALSHVTVEVRTSEAGVA